jgi:endonuclease-3
MGGKPRRPSPERIHDVVAILARTWPEARCELDFESPYQLLVATILSAQSTDVLVNTVTPALFARYPDAAALAAADPAEVERLVHSTGFFRQKSKNIIAMARQVMTDFGGEIPRTMEALIRLPGVARKTANVVLGCAFGTPVGIAVDTHVKRLSGRLGLSAETDPVKIERDLLEIIPREHWASFNQQLIWHGRRVCGAKKPSCEECSLAPRCPSFPLSGVAAA